MNKSTEISKEYQIFQTLWEGIEIEIRHCSNWLNLQSVMSKVDHIEVESKDRQKLPITETGYKSNFVDPIEITEASGVVELVLAWLVEASNTKAWQAHLKTSGQGNLFDW